MEHLPSPEGRHLGTIYRTRANCDFYDGGPMDFLDWPSRSNFPETWSMFQPNKNGTVVLFLDEGSTNACYILFQTWLYFGLLHTFLHNIGRYKDDGAWLFVYQDTDNTHYVTTEHLGPEIDELVRDHTFTPQCLAYRQACLLRVYDMVKRVSQQVPKLDRNMLLSILVLAEAFDRANRLMAGIDPQASSSNTIHWGSLGRGNVANLKDYPKSLSFRMQSHILAGHLFVYQCMQKLKNSEPASTGDSEPNKHCCKTKDCKLIEIDISAVQSILEAGDIAVVRAEGKLQVVSSRECSGYVAISHAWAQGLGNPIANALPRCQVGRLSKFVRRLAGTKGLSQPVFWLDTLCCPVNSARHRNLCLERMAQIYREADCVLIVDPALSRVDRMDDLELTARFMLSTWVTRLWTFQEGFLARRLYLQMKDCVVDIDELRIAVGYSAPHVEYLPLVLPLVRGLDSIRPHVGVENEMETVLDCRGCMRFRELSIRADETLCLSTCLGLDPGEIIQADDKMPAFWRAYAASGKKIKRSIIFFYGERLDTPGFRWSPASIVYAAESHANAYEHGKNAFLGDGLFVRYPGWVLTGQNDSYIGKQDCRGPDGAWYQLAHFTEDGLERYHLPFPRAGENSITLIAQQRLPQTVRDRSVNCLGGSIVGSGDVIRFRPYATIGLVRHPQDRIDALEIVWQALERLDREAVEALDQGDGTFVGTGQMMAAEVVGDAMMTESFFRKLALEMLDHRPLEVEEVYPEDQMWCVL